MTAQRLVRGSKARILIGVCLVLLAIGVIFHYENTVSQLETIKKSNDICTQQQESLSIQLQVIVDYKTRLEKSLQAEKSAHKQTKTELEARVNDEKLRRDKTSIEANLRFTSLQQHYKLLQAKHEDLKEKSDKLQQQYMEETDQLQAKIKEQQEQIKLAGKDKEKSMERLKSDYMLLQVGKEQLEEKFKRKNFQHSDLENQVNHLIKINRQLTKENGILKKGSNIFHNIPNMEIPLENTVDDNVSTTAKNFAKQVEVSDSVYQIKGNDDPKREEANHNIMPENAQQIDSPKLNADGANSAQNNVENNVLQKPNNSKSTVKTSSISVGNPAGVQPLMLPTVTPSTKSNQIPKELNNNSENILRPPNTQNKKIKLPNGVVPIPNEEPQNRDEQPKNEKADDKNIPDDIKFALPNRYRNNIIESQLANEIIKETKVDNKKSLQENLKEQEANHDLNNPDNNAMEVMDQPRLNIQREPQHQMEVNNQNMEANDIKAQEVEPVLKDPLLQDFEKRQFKKQHIDSLGLGRRANEAVLGAPGGGAQYEGEGDYDKDGHKEDLQIEGNEPDGEEDDDIDDYGGHLVGRQKEPAVRN